MGIRVGLKQHMILQIRLLRKELHNKNYKSQTLGIGLSEGTKKASIRQTRAVCRQNKT
jgi:hypothetical protein